MKKTLIILGICLSSIFAYAQIGELSPQQKTIEIKRALKNVSVIHNIVDSTYTLSIGSDNQYEKKCARLLLGTGEEEALNSLVNLYKALQTPDQRFEVQTYTISTFDVSPSKKHYGIVNTVGPLEFTAGSYVFEEEGLGNAMLIIIDNMNDFDCSDAIVTTKKVWGDAKSAIGITGLTCDFYLPSLGVHFVGGPDKYDFKTDSKKYTKMVSSLTEIDVPWNTNQYEIVVMGLDNNIIKIHKPLFEKICRLKAQ